jgi:hypothetical protein
VAAVVHYHHKLPADCVAAFNTQPNMSTMRPSRAFQIVVAATRNWGIGSGGGLPFDLPGDVFARHASVEACHTSHIYSPIEHCDPSTCAEDAVHVLCAVWLYTTSQQQNLMTEAAGIFCLQVT